MQPVTRKRCHQSSRWRGRGQLKSHFQSRTSESGKSAVIIKRVRHFQGDSTHSSARIKGRQQSDNHSMRNYAFWIDSRRVRRGGGMCVTSRRDVHGIVGRLIKPYMDRSDILGGHDVALTNLLRLNFNVNSMASLCKRKSNTEQNNFCTF